MWYLIIPPIIVVVSLSFALWYLSRKGADPLVAEKALGLQEEAKRQVSFPRVKTFFLRLLEKMAYSFKVKSLKAHNILHNVTHSLKESRLRFQKSDKQPIVSETETDSAVETTLETPIARKRKKFFSAKTEIVQTAVSEEPISISRPMVSETVVRPERERAGMRENSFREADLIARITANPKDFAAYEELGDYYLEIGNIKDAKECYKQVLKLSPAERMVRIKIRRLEKILSQGGE